MIKNFNAWHVYRKTTKQIIALLPGKNKKILEISSKQPDEIINDLQRITNADTIILDQLDVWRYGNDPMLIDFFQRRLERFYILTLGYQHRKICENVYELAVNSFFPGSSTEFKLKSADTKIPYGCLNRTPRFHRTWLGLKLFQSNLLDRVIYSLSSVHEQSLHLEALLKAESRWSEFEAQVPFKYLDEDGVYIDLSTLHPAYSTFCNIVTESETEFIGHDRSWPTPVITEKSWKPFLSCQIPVYLAAQGHLTYLRKFGFELFDDILPAGYDNLDTFSKVDAIAELIASCPIDKIYFDNIDKIQHNYNLVTSDRVKQQMIDEISNFLYN